MASILGQLTDRAMRLVTRGTTVTAVEDIGPAFRLIRVDAPGASWSPGAKVQFQIEGMTLRTYTPFDWDGDAASFLLYRHGGNGPAEAWADSLAVGDDVAVFGPRKSLSLDDLGTAPVIVGDETSFAVTAAWRGHGSAPAAARIFEVTDVAASTAALEALDLMPSDLVARTADDGHLGELTERVLTSLGSNPGAPLVITGKAQTIRAVRGAVKDAGLSPTTRVKAYWDPNRAGLD